MKERIDTLLVRLGYCETREKAKRHLMAGLVFVEGQRVDKPGTMVDEEKAIEVKGVAIPFVSRGGLKLDKAIKTYSIDINQRVCMDIGASTGGFTDCMLQNGAAKVYAVDVGYGQLDWKLRSDTRVVNLERTNIRYITAEQVVDALDFFSVDVAFISLKLVLPPILTFLRANALGVLLIKPQFEAGRDKVGKGGVVRDPQVHHQVLVEVLDFVLHLGFELKGLDFSPITGPNGNIEFLAYVAYRGQFADGQVAEGNVFECRDPEAVPLDLACLKVVERAHQTLR